MPGTETRVVDLRAHTCFAMWRNWIFIEVETEDGRIGIGECTLEGREKTMLGHLEDLRRYLVGRDSAAIEELHRDLLRDPFWVGGYVANSGIAAIDIALWDLFGQRVGLPVWQLLGGKLREKVRVYANCWYFGVTTPEEWRDRAAEVVELGYTAMKFDPFMQAGPECTREQLEQAVALVAAVREGAGPKTDLMIEGHGRFDRPAAIRIGKALERFDCFWFEEPLEPRNVQALAHLAHELPMPVATGERLYSRHDYRELLTSQAAPFIQPDVTHCAGITELKKIANMAETWNVGVAPHNPNGPVATTASLHVDAVIPNFTVQEMCAPWDASWRHTVVTGCPKVKDGYLEIPDKPGLGLELHVEEIEKHPYQTVDLSFYNDKSVLDHVSLRDPSSADGVALA